MAVLVPLLVLQIRGWRTSGDRRRLIPVTALAVALALSGAMLGYGIATTYVRYNSWTFSYYVFLQPDAAQPAAVILPSVADERLLDGLAVDYGVANWSFVDTIHGPGVYIGFTGNASLSTFLSRFPPPNPLPDTTVTMLNGSGFAAEAWIYYAGTANPTLSFSTNGFSTGMTIEPGWNLYPNVPHAVAAA